MSEIGGWMMPGRHVIRIRWTKRRKRLVEISVSVAFMGLSIGMLVAAHDQRSAYVQGLLLNLGTGLVVVIPLSFLASVLVGRVSDLQRAISLKEASDLARMSLKERSLRRAGKRVEAWVRYRRQHVLKKFDSEKAADQTAQRAWSSLAEVADEVVAIAVDSGLVENPWGGEPLVAAWAGVSWEQLVMDDLISIGYPLTAPLTYYRRPNWVLSPPYDDAPPNDSGPMPEAQEHPAWKISLLTYSRGSMVTVLMGHQVVDEHGVAGKPWFRRVDADVHDETLDAQVGRAAAEWCDRSGTELELLAAMLPNA